MQPKKGLNFWQRLFFLVLATDLSEKRPELLAKTFFFFFWSSPPIRPKQGLNFWQTPFLFCFIFGLRHRFVRKKPEFLAKTFLFWSAGILLGLNVATSLKGC